MIDTDKYEGHSKEWTLNYNDWAWATSMFTAAGETNEADALLVIDAPKLLAEVLRLQKEIKVLSKYRDIVEKYDNALLADGDTDPRWSELYD